MAGRVKLFGIAVECSNKGCLHDVHGLIFSTLALQIAAGNVMEVMIPYVTHRLAERARVAEQEAERTSKHSEPSALAGIINAVNPLYDEDDELMQHTQEVYDFELPPFMSKHEIEAHKPTYTTTFHDYNELVIQYGYVTMF